MKRHLNATLAVTLMLLLCAGQLPLLAAAPERIVRPIPPKPRRSNKQDPIPQSRPAGESTTILPDGRTLLLGGESADGPLTNAEIRDSRSGAITRLAVGLQFGRAWHTATVLPDGLVLVFGGVGSNGRLVNTAELFDPENQSFTKVSTIGLTGRAYHTATLLSDGRLFMAGGVDGRGRLLKTIETWNPDANAANVSNATLQSGRRKATALLQPDGTIVLNGGVDEGEATVSGGEIYDPADDVVFWSPETQVGRESSVRLMFSSPADGDAQVDPKIRLSLRFSKQLKSETVSRETVTLFGPRGEVPARIISAEAGRLLFVTPLAALAADTSYNLKVDGPTAPDGQKLEFTAISFKTKADPSCGNGPCNSTRQITDADSWIPSANNFKGSWSSGRPNATTKDLPPLQAPAGETALAGQVLALSGNPLPNVTLQVDQQTALTDNTGRFLLEGLQAGRRVLTIQGHTASRAGKKYGTFDVLVDVAADKTTTLPYKIWLPVLDEQNAVALPIPTNREVGVTTPRVPGMEVRVPAASVLRMPAGAHQSHGLTRRELTSMAITPIPTDRMPFPLPQGISDGLVFTLQLHGARVEGLHGQKRPGLRIVYPNYLNLPAGDRVDFWNYEPSGEGWYMYGHGTVTPDRRQVMPDPGVELQSMYCISLMNKGDAPGTGPAATGRSAGDPVDLGTGLFVHSKTDLILPDVIPITLSRTYRQNDSIERSFGKGMTNPYDMYIFGTTTTFGEIILPDGGRVHFDIISQSPFQYECTNSPTIFYKATMRQIAGVGPNGAWEVKLKDGTVLQFGIKVLFGDIFGPHQTITGLSVVRDRFGNTLTISRDDNFRMSRVTSPNGRWVQFSYSDSSKRVTQATDNIGRSVSYTYDASGRLWKVTDPKGGVTEYLYDSNDRMLTIRDARNIVYLTNEYDASSGRITRQTMVDNGVYQFAYTVDAQGKITQTDVTDPRNYIHRTTFNSGGYVLSDVLALGTPQQQTYTYQRQAGSNLILTVTDPLNRQTAMVYDALGNITSITRLAGTPEAISTTITYNPTFNQIATVTDPLNHTSSFTYDSLGLLTTITDPLNHAINFTYNNAGQVLTIADPLSHTVQYTYESGDLVSITDALNHTSRRYTDAAGRLSRIIDPLGQTTRYEYDSLNLTTSVIDAAQASTSFTYDANGNTLSVTDARNSATSYIYDDMDRVITRRDPLLHDVVYQYNAVGNISQLTDRKNQVTQFTYDPLNRLTQVTYADSSTTAYTYDSVNRLTHVVDSVSGTITYGYDNLDRLTSESTPQGTVSYTYDAAGRCTSMTALGQPTVNYTYDDDSRLTQVTQGTATVTIAYDDAGRRTSLTLPNGQVTEYEYDAASNLTKLTYKHAGNILGDLTYEYDANGRRTRMGGSFARSVSPEPLVSATYNAANQQITFGARVLNYDLNGNLTSDGENTYVWGARDQLTSISGPGVNASFNYDYRGRRIAKNINGTTSSFLYDGWNAVQEQSDVVGTTNFLNGGLDEVFTRTDSSGVFGFLRDGVGSSLALSNTTGSLQTEFAYGAFGSSAESGASSNNSTQYTGRENDGTGLQYNRNRYYSATLQRFISQDPLGFSGGDINIYAYVGNNPINETDPLGLERLNYTLHPAPTTAARKDDLTILGGLSHISAGFGDYLTAGLAQTAAGLANSGPGCGCVMLPPGYSPTGHIRHAMGSGTTIDPSATPYRVGQGLAVAHTIAMSVAGVAGAISSARSVTVIHFTDDVGMAAISESGTLGTSTIRPFVTLESEIPTGATASQVESLLEIAPGRGSYSISLQTPRSNLMTPFNGPTTSGGAVQFQLRNPVPIAGSKFVPTPR